MESNTRIKREKGNRKKYKDIMNKPGPLHGFHSSDIFLLSLAFGYSKGIAKPLEKVEEFIKPENFSKDLLPLVESMGIAKSDDGYELLSKPQSEINKKAEEYANNGIDLLYAEYSGHEKEVLNKWLKEIQKDIKDKNILKYIDEL